MSFGVYNNLISNKMREEMYLKHLRQVEKINNREADSLKKELKDYRFISDLHKHNKQKAYLMRSSSRNLQIQKKNQQIYKKIQSISSDQNIKQKIRPSSYTLQKSRNSEDTNPINKLIQSKKPTLHARYRQDQQQKIEHENKKIAKAIIGQKSLLLPLINQQKIKSGAIRHSFSQNQTSVHSHNVSLDTKNDDE